MLIPIIVLSVGILCLLLSIAGYLADIRDELREQTRIMRRETRK